MAAVFSLRIILISLVLVYCSGQYYYDYYDYYDYGDYGTDTSWCPFGINGMCVCENDVVDCSSQGMSSIPQDLPATTRQLILKDNQISTIDFLPLATFTSLEHLDLSSNSLHSLPQGIFEALTSLQSVNLSNNPWQCDCTLSWLSVWVLTAADHNIAVLDAASTNCVGWPALSMLEVSPIAFLPCVVPVPVRNLRSVAPGPTPLHISPNWTSVCFYWFPQSTCDQGPSTAGSCELSFDTRQVTFITYSSFTTHANSSACHNFCFANNFTYYAFENTTLQCLCGEEEGNVQCSDCSSNSYNLSSSDPTLCMGSYMRVHAYHVFSEVGIIFSSPVTIHTPTSFILSGFPSVVASFSWDFGDGAKQDNVNAAVTSHTYVYPGWFPLTVEVCGSGGCRSVQLHVKVNAGSVDSDLLCPVLSEVSGKIDLNVTLTNSYLSRLRWSRVSAAGAVVYAGDCESGWIPFHDRCLKQELTPQSIADAESACQQEGGAILRLNNLSEELEIPTLMQLSSTSTTWFGAEHNGTHYHWTGTTEVAMLLQELYISPTAASSCLVITGYGVMTADCSGQHPVICQKDPTPCPLGEQLGTSGYCYYQNSTLARYQEARLGCQNMYGGDLATLSDLSVNNVIMSALGVSSSSWIGLEAPDLLGHYTWVDGEAHSWAGANGQTGIWWPCVSMTASGHYEATDCNQALSFICRYSLNDVVTSEQHIAGTSDLQNNGSTFRTLSESSQAPPFVAGQTVVLPGVWFAKNGHLLEVNLHLEPQSSRNLMAVQVLRPTCPSGKVVIRPGCDQNVFAKCGSSSSGCPTLSTCTADSEHVCPLTDACIQSSTPCSCAASTSVGANCSATDPASDLSFSLVGQALFAVPASGGSFRAVMSSNIEVQVDDVLAFQSTGSTLGLCHQDVASEWRQVAFVASGASWTSTNQDVTLSLFTKQENYLCLFSAVYGSSKTVSVPNSLAYVSEPTLYTFQAEVVDSSATPKTCTVEAVQDLGDLMWVYPMLSYTSAGATVFVEMGVPQSLVAILPKGSHLQVSWQLDTGISKTGSMAASCPSDVPSTVSDCQHYHSQLLEPFLILSDTYSSSSPVSVNLNVSNPLGSKGIDVIVLAIEPIQNLVLYHSSCSASAPCSPLVEVGVQQEFLASKTSGAVDQYEFKINGTVLSTSQSTNLTHPFSTPGMYVMSVSASNSLGVVEATLNVDAKVRGHVTQTSLEPPSPITAELGKNTTFTLKASVAKRAELNVSWEFGDGQSESSVIQVSGYSLNAFKEHAYITAGVYTLKVTVIDMFGTEVKTQAVVNVLSVITSLSTFASPQTIAAGNTSTFTVNVQSGTASPNYGNITYTFNFDGAVEDTYITEQLSRTVSYNFNTNGTYNVSVKVKNDVSLVVDYIAVTVEACPSRVKLTYNGPKNLTEQLTFTATATKGSNLIFTFDLGDGSAPVYQSHANVFHTYNTSGTYNASVVASNAVCQEFDTENVIVMDASTLLVRKISHDQYGPLNQNVLFTVDVITLDIQKVTFTWEVGTTRLTRRGFRNFDYPFATVGNYTVTVTLKLDNSGVRKSTSTVVTIQEQVSSVVMTAPSLMAFTQQQPVVGNFSASSPDGTDVSFRWYNNSVPLSVQGSNITLQTSTAGTFNISVIAYNEVSEAGDWALVEVQQKVENVVVTCYTCVNNQFMAVQQQTDLRCTYLGSNVTFAWKYGNFPLSTTNQLLHTFSQPGSHMLEVTVANAVSSETVMFNIVLQEEVTPVTITADHLVIAEGSSTILTASHAKGSSMEYTWQCGSHSAHTTTANTTSVTFSFWGIHTCNVTVANNVSSEQTSIDIKVLQDITSVDIKNHTTNSTLYVPISKLTQIEADCNTVYEVNFTWNIMQAGAVIRTFTGKVLSYRFTAVARYELRLTAANAISSISIKMVVEAMEEISQLQLRANDTTVVVGAGAEFTADMSTGTNPVYQWSANTVPLSSVGNVRSFNYTFSSADTYVMEVNASNLVSSATANITILVQHPVVGLSVSGNGFDFQKPYISQNQQVQFKGSVINGSNPQFEWVVLSPSAQQTVLNTSLWQNFSESGEYSIQLSASNAVSQEGTSFLVYVEREITSLDLLMRPHNFTATGAVVILMGNPNSDATPVSYLWIVDGHTVTAVSFSHSFQSPGFYNIQLAAYNNISRMETNQTVEVQDPVASLQISDCSVTRQAGVPFSLTASALGTSIAYTWTVQLPTQNRTTHGANLTLALPAGGTYPVHLLAANKVKQETLMCMVAVQDAIANVAVSIVDPPVDYIFTNQNITFLVTGDYLTNATYTWNFEGLSTNVTSSSSFVMVFDTAQSMTLNVTVGNNVSQMSATVNFTVQELKCHLPIVTPVGSDSRSAFRSKPTQFDVYIDNKGCTQYQAIHTWNVFEVADCTRPLPATSVSLTSVDTDKPTLILPAGQLPTTSQHFCVRYTLGYHNTPVAEEVFYNLSMLATPLVAVITGGAWRQVDGSGPVCLDGSLSYNPDDPDAGSVGMSFSWRCQAVSGGGTCFQPVTSTNSSLCLTTFTSATYNISLTVSLPGQAAHVTSQTLAVLVTSPPIMTVGVECVSCQATGDYRISSSHHTVLSAYCSACSAAVSYSWDVMEDTGTALVLGPDDTSTGTSVANLVVLRRTALRDNHSYTFTVTVDSLDGSRTQSKAYITLLPNVPPTGGVCTATPDTITVFQELVTVTCSSWVDQDDTDAELLYEIKVVHNAKSYLLYYGTRRTQAVYVAPWPGSTNTTTQLVVSVLDGSGARTEALTKWITFRDAGIPAANMSQTLYLAANSTLTTLMQQGDPIPLLQYALAMTQMLNAASTGSLQTTDREIQAVVRTAITLCVSSSVPVETLQQAQQMAYLLSLLTEFSAEYQISGCHTLIIQNLQTIVTVLDSSVRPGLDREDFAFESLFSSLYHLLQAVNLGSSATASTSVSQAFPQLPSLSSQVGTTLQVLDFSGATFTTAHKKNVVSEAFTLAEDVTSVVLKSVVLNEDSLIYQLGGMHVEGVRTTVGSVGSYFEQGGCRFLLPDSMFSSLTGTEEVLKIMIMLNTNPFTWGYIDQLTITSRVPTLSFKYANGSDLSVSDLPSTIEVLMFDSNDNNYTVTNSSLLQNQHYNPLANAQFDTWLLGAGSSKKLLVDGNKGSSGMSALHVQVRVDALPNKTEQAAGITPTAAIKAYLGAGFEASEDQYTAYKEITTAHMAPGVDHRYYTFFVSAEDFEAGTEYMVTIVNEDAGRDVNISAAMYLSSCQYYDETREVWKASGCSVSDESIPVATVCQCNHLTAFGSSSLVPISSIDFTDLAGLQLGLNPVALVAVSTILLMYIIGVIICRRLDRADLCRISTVPLCGRDGVFKYHITVITGRQIGAGTSAHIGIKLYGDNSKTEPRHLTKNAAFQRNSRDTFIIATDNELGCLHKVRVWHDNSGPSPCWYLTQIQVQDLQNGQRYIFSANSWLSLEVADGMLQKEICAAAPEELHCFSRVFNTSLSNNMAERHMWLSIFNRPDHSRFTRVQRATCCVSLSYLYMFINAMWYGLIKDQSQKGDPISWNMIGWEEVIIALVSVVAIFPVAVGLIFIFKRSRSKADVFTQAMRPQSAQTLEIECDVSHYGGSLRTMTPNEDWSTIFERESTTESIPPISSQLRRTTAVARSNRDTAGIHGTFPGSGKKSTVQCIRRTQDLMWNQENILKSWPEKLPSFAEEEKEKPSVKAASAAGTAAKADVAVSSGTTTASGAVAASSAAPAKISKTTSLTSKTSPAPALKKSKSAPAKPTGKAKETKSVEQPSTSSAQITTTRKTASFKEVENDSDDHEEFMQRLDELDRQLQKSASSRSKASLEKKKARGLVKKHSSRSSQGAIEDLFESDDEWANEGLENKGTKTGEGNSFNPRQDPNLDRRASVTSLMRLRAASMHVPSSAGSSFLRRDSTFMRHDGTMHSFMMSEKSRTTLSAMLKNRMQMMGGPEEESGCRLPWFCVYIGYTICLLLSILSILMVLLYGYNFGPAVALEWLLSVLLAFLCSIFVLEPLKVVMLTLYVAVIVKDAEKDVESDSIDVMPSIEANEQLKEVKFRPLGGFALLQAQDEGRKKLRLRTMIRQTIAYLLLTATLLAVANVYFGPAMFRANGHIENTMVYTDTSVSGSVDFYNISSTDVFWEWTKDVMTPALYRSQLVSTEESPVLIGAARLRQIRSTLVDCLTNETEEDRSCIGRLDFTEDTAAYSLGWLNTTSGNASWVYSSADQLNTWSKYGQDLLYPGGGYVQELGTSYNQTLDTLQQLDDAGWLDRRSRALFVEWTSYSAGEDLFSAVTLLLEFPISGGVLVSHSIRTQPLYVFYADRVDPLYVCQVLLLVPALYLLIQTLITLSQQKSKFLRSPGNWLQVLVTLTCVACVGLYFTCVVMATDTMDRFSDNTTSFTNFEHIAGQVRYVRVLSVYQRTLATAFGKLSGATLIFILLLLTYTQLGYLFYGSFVHSYRSVQNSLVSLVGVMKGSVDFTFPLEHQPVFSHFFFFSFHAFVYGLFVALVIAIMQDAYKLTRSQMYFKSTLEPQDYEMIDFMLKRFKLWAGFTKPKPAFRRVKFEGLPSLPSRGSSSATSSLRPLSQNSRERSTPTPDLIASMNNADALDRLLPAWERLLTLLGTMETLEKEEQRQVGRVQVAFNRWSSEQDKKPGSSGTKKKPPNKKPLGKPPVDPKSKFSRFRSNFQNSNTDGPAAAKAVQRQSVTPPPSSTTSKGGKAQNKPMVRTLSDQGNKSFGLLDRPTSDSQKLRPAPDIVGKATTPGAAGFNRDNQSQQSPASGSSDVFPGSAAQRSRSGSDGTNTRPGAVNPAPPTGVQKDSAASNPKPGASGVGRKEPGTTALQSARVAASKTTSEDSKKQAWDG